MLRDMEGHKIQIAREGNGHILVYGKSGQGKTYFLCRMLEEYCKIGKKVLIIDFSGSYTEAQLKKNNFSDLDEVKRYDLMKQVLVWHYRVKEDELFYNDVLDILCRLLKCNSIYQMDMLKEALERCIKKNGMFNLKDMIDELREMMDEACEDELNVRNQEYIDKILMKIRPYSIKNFKVVRGNTDDKWLVSIIDLTNYPAQQRKFLAEFFLELFWKEVYRQEFANHCDVILLDEMQFMSMKIGDTLSDMLREGRKKNIEVVLSTQFVSSYDREALLALQQVDNTVIFHPADKDCKWAAMSIDCVDYKKWQKKLLKLRRGEAILKGFYRLNNGNNILSTPIIIDLVEER